MVANIEQIDHLIKSRKLAVTAIRRQVLALLSRPGCAFTRKQIETELGEYADRVTIYRTLKVLVEHFLVHKIVMDQQEVKFKLIDPQKGSDHPHFYCASCQQLMCLPPKLINKELVPEGYQIHSWRVVMEGLCNQCSQQPDRSGRKPFESNKNNK